MTNPDKFDQKFIDPKTGETVIRLNVDPKLLAEIDIHINSDAKHKMDFVNISGNIVLLESQQKNLFDAINKLQESIGKEVIRIREKMKLDSSWIYNIQLKMMEKREPPENIKMLESGIIDVGNL